MDYPSPAGTDCSSSSTLEDDADELLEDKCLMDEAIDETEYLLEVHGVYPGRKGEGITRLLYENLNGLQSTLSNKNEKLETARRVIDDFQADVVCYNKHRQNLRHKANRNGFRQMFTGGRRTYGRLHLTMFTSQLVNTKRVAQQC